MEVGDTFIAAFSDFFKIVGDTNRLRILFALKDGARSVSQIMDQTELPQTLVSFHLKTLRETGIVETKRSKTFVYYSVHDLQLIDDILSLSKHLEYFQPREVEFEFEWPPWKNCMMWRRDAR
ncbi:DNA-binding transcriptional regulator, ArsR family [Alkalispirochaeta americana]|uniref:DNA-binding transcriptional regulator, ArsR family n=1 Tax=Alkalispirochaeta americana TaxID=159291 RepID=A0A1N6XZG8_9SPIO|nr:metalloregulator ArsR/SmtB family transcription factor [Alkalispirochaeta americana]SIR07782.1 DNA-binding transcriptional regulator, ArsR family [Alkalispirochaeta americana]